MDKRNLNPRNKTHNFGATALVTSLWLTNGDTVRNWEAPLKRTRLNWKKIVMSRNVRTGAVHGYLDHQRKGVGKQTDKERTRRSIGVTIVKVEDCSLRVLRVLQR